MMVRTIGTGALALVAAACSGGGNETDANLTNEAAPAANTTDAQNRVRSLDEGQRNGVLIRAIRDARFNCQHVEGSLLSETSKSLPVYMATCEDGAVYAVAIRDDGSASVSPVMPAEGK